MYTLKRQPASLKVQDKRCVVQWSFKWTSRSSLGKTAVSQRCGQATGKRPHLAWWAPRVSKTNSLLQ